MFWSFCSHNFLTWSLFYVTVNICSRLIIYYYSHPLPLALHLSSYQRTCVNRLKELPQSLKKCLAEECKDQTSRCLLLHSNCVGVYLISDLYVFSLHSLPDFWLWHVSAGWLLLWVPCSSGLSGMRIFFSITLGPEIASTQNSTPLSIRRFSPSLCLPVMWCFLTSLLPCAKKKYCISYLYFSLIKLTFCSNQIF